MGRFDSMTDGEYPDMSRRRFPGAPDKEARHAFARKVAERAEWFLTPEGERVMDDKRYVAHSVAAGMVQGVLELAQDAGLSSLQVIESALLNYEASLDKGSPEVREVRIAIRTVLDLIPSRSGMDQG